MLTRRQKIALVGASAYVLVAVVLAVVWFARGAWVEGALWVVSAALLAIAYGMSAARWRRAATDLASPGVVAERSMPAPPT